MPSSSRKTTLPPLPPILAGFQPERIQRSPPHFGLNPFNKRPEKLKKHQIRCHHCLALGHIAKNCRDPWRCASCLRWGHRTRDCRLRCSSPPARAQRSPLPPPAQAMPRLGDASTRPTESHLVVQCTPDMQVQRAHLEGHGVIAWLDDARCGVDKEAIADTIASHFGIRRSDMRAANHRDSFFLTFEHRHHRETVVAVCSFTASFGVINLRPWRASAHADHVALRHNVHISLENVPLEAWNEVTVRSIIGDACELHYFDSRSLRHEDAVILGCWVWTTNPSKIPLVHWLTLTDAPRSSTTPATERPGLQHRILVHLGIHEDHTKTKRRGRMDDRNSGWRAFFRSRSRAPRDDGRGGHDGRRARDDDQDRQRGRDSRRGQEDHRRRRGDRSPSILRPRRPILLGRGLAILKTRGLSRTRRGPATSPNRGRQDMPLEVPRPASPTSPLVSAPLSPSALQVEMPAASRSAEVAPACDALDIDASSSSPGFGFGGRRLELDLSVPLPPTPTFAGSMALPRTPSPPPPPRRSMNAFLRHLTQAVPSCRLLPWHVAELPRPRRGASLCGAACGSPAEVTRVATRLLRRVRCSSGGSAFPTSGALRSPRLSATWTSSRDPSHRQ
ncbi:hypothetical protein BRADI_5g03802v3 [Brachypodium distachyon]|uniref:CCHC-type domain-containing protein n=1 Tax=Brachypodium distachyon TaxID=15368 RepID=A0A0Q3E2E6_BRADI|nr:hypothetical protein BRADI_5g03802v3 [Brachypodium distachyon]